MISDISNKAVVFLVTNTGHLNKEMFHVQKNSEFRNNHMILLSVLTKDLWKKI